jgi:hypothetical protein
MTLLIGTVLFGKNHARNLLFWQFALLLPDTIDRSQLFVQAFLQA